METITIRQRGIAPVVFGIIAFALLLLAPAVLPSGAVTLAQPLDRRSCGAAFIRRPSMGAT